MFLGGAAIAIGVYIARIAGGAATTKAISVWWIWPFVGVAAIGVVLPFTARPGPPRITVHLAAPPSVERQRAHRFPTVDDVNRALGRDTSKGDADTTSSAPTHDG